MKAVIMAIRHGRQGWRCTAARILIVESPQGATIYVTGNAGLSAATELPLGTIPFLSLRV
jgi:hypothetical protein